MSGVWLSAASSLCGPSTKRYIFAAQGGLGGDSGAVSLDGVALGCPPLLGVLRPIPLRAGVIRDLFVLVSLLHGMR